MRALAKHPADRYPTAASMANDLANFVDGRPVGPRPAAPPAPSRWRERRKVIGWGVFGAAILLVVTGLALRSGSLERQQARDARLIEQLILDSTDLVGLPCQPGLVPEDEHRRLANAIWDRSRSWVDALADRPTLAPIRADLLIQLARHAESVGFDRDTRTAWEAAVTAIEPLTQERSSPWTRRADLAGGLAALGEIESGAGRQVAAQGRFEQAASVWNQLAKIHRDRLGANSGRAPGLLNLAEAIVEGDRAARNANLGGVKPAAGVGEAEQVANQLRDRRDLAPRELLRLIRLEISLARRSQSIENPTWAAIWGGRAIHSAEENTGGKPMSPDVAIEQSRARLLVGLVEADLTDFGFEGKAVELLRSSSTGFAEAIPLDPMNFSLKRDLATAELGLASIFARFESNDQAVRSFRQALAWNKRLRRNRPEAHSDLDRSAAIRSGLADVEANRGRCWSSVASMAVAVAHEHQAVRLAPGIVAYRQARRVYVEKLFRLIIGQRPLAFPRSE